MCSRNGSAKLVGKCTLLPKMDEEMSFGAFMTIIRTRHNPYLLHFFNSNAFRCQLGSAATTTINQITRRMLDDISVPLYPKEQEDYIVSLFNQIDELIWTETQKLELFDELVKSRFIELFGDPVSNPMGWKTELLKNATSKIGSGATPKGGKESYQTEGVTLIRSMNVHDGRFEYKDLAHITDEQAKQLDNVTIEENDVFINITGASVARSCIVPKQILPARVNQHVAIIRCITSKLIPVFANNMFLNNSFKGQLLDIGEAGGATRQAITKQQLETLEVILPPMELQEQFAAFVEQTDKSKMVVQRSIAELEEVKKSLMQKYFG
ncbi:MAG: restriction endonuclease subunit S [Clostridia bacterium]|nr:restriction endonuclease subunit S [Clostridia bacterium]